VPPRASLRYASLPDDVGGVPRGDINTCTAIELTNMPIINRHMVHFGASISLIMLTSPDMLGRQNAFLGTRGPDHRFMLARLVDVTAKESRYWLGGTTRQEQR